MGHSVIRSIVYVTCKHKMIRNIHVLLLIVAVGCQCVLGAHLLRGLNSRDGKALVNTFPFNAADAGYDSSPTSTSQHQQGQQQAQQGQQQAQQGQQQAQQQQQWKVQEALEFLEQ